MIPYFFRCQGLAVALLQRHPWTPWTYGILSFCGEVKIPLISDHWSWGNRIKGVGNGSSGWLKLKLKFRTPILDGTQAPKGFEFW